MSSSRFIVRLLPVAEQDLQDILSFVAADNVQAAAKLADTIEQNLHRLEQHPRLGKIPNDETLVRLAYRVLVVGNYLIVYKLRDKTVLVYGILHGAGDLPRLLADPES